MRAIGPAVSCVCDTGTIPSRLTRPSVGFRPTQPLIAAGDTIEPSVSVPTETATSPAATAAAEPELDPLVVRSSAYGLRDSPPRALQPLVERVERKFAHSLRLAFATITAPARRSRATRCASRVARTPSSASEPAVVDIRSPVAMLSFNATVTPCSGPRATPAARSASSACAIASASGFNSMIAFRRGPSRSIRAMRSSDARTARDAGAASCGGAGADAPARSSSAVCPAEAGALASRACVGPSAPSV
ncbi:hypothetical protein BIM11_6232 [Burkholderia pseudomallei]|nr:hypothetical protein BIM11_6232 [Burkholderia pseudomallei]